jgi:hypothetical protein
VVLLGVNNTASLINMTRDTWNMEPMSNPPAQPGV